MSKIRNADISWDGNFFGLMPQITGAASVEVLKLGKPAVPQLVVALDDPERFAAAHVLLTQIQMTGGGYEISASRWNQLKVELLANGRVQLHPEHREDLKTFWRARLGGA